MKPATVAKVVNPLGTVVNVQSDDDSDLEVSEDSVIHENCDEALFRPIVTPQPRICHEINKRYADNIITKSLEANTEVAVKVLKKKCKSRESSPRKVKESPIAKTDDLCTTKPSTVTDGKGRIPAKTVVAPTKVKSKNKIAKSDISVLETPLCLKASDIPMSETFTTGVSSDKKVMNFDIPPLDNEDFFSLESIPKEKCEDVCVYPSSANKENKNDQVKNDFDDCTNESGEDKNFAKRNRKPKTKLGIKIASINNENSNTSKKMEGWSWSSIAASKPAQEKSLIDSVEKEKTVSLDLPEIEFVEEFTVRLPRKSEPVCMVSDLIDINTPQDDKTIKENTSNDTLKIISEEVSLIKIDKSSDDEKGETSSSPAEATESDDSGKIQESAVFEDMISSKVIVAPVTKSSRRKKKKK